MARDVIEQGGTDWLHTRMKYPLIRRSPIPVLTETVRTTAYKHCAESSSIQATFNNRLLSVQKDEETSFGKYQGNRVATAIFYVSSFNVIIIIIIITILFIMVKTHAQPHNNLSRRTATIYLMPTLSRRTATTTRFSPKAARKTGCAKVMPTSDQVGFYLASTHQMAPQSTYPIKQTCYSFIDLGRMKS